MCGTLRSIEGGATGTGAEPLLISGSVGGTVSGLGNGASGLERSGAEPRRGWGRGGGKTRECVVLA